MGNLYSVRLGTTSSCFCTETSESLPEWNGVHAVYRSQEFEVRLHTTRTEYEAATGLEFLKDYDFTLEYHPGKANVVADTLSRLGADADVVTCQMTHEHGLLEAADTMSTAVMMVTLEVRICGRLKQLTVSTQSVHDGQHTDSAYRRFSERAHSAEHPDWSVSRDGCLRFRERL